MPKNQPLASFLKKTEVLPGISIWIWQKSVKNAKIEKVKLVILGDFQTLCLLWNHHLEQWQKRHLAKIWHILLQCLLEVHLDILQELINQVHLKQKKSFKNEFLKSKKNVSYVEWNIDAKLSKPQGTFLL